jgi:polyadenylate-binding protein
MALQQPSASLYVGELAPEVTEALLFEIFNAVGAVASVRVCRDAATRRSLGYAYVNFHRAEDAERALDTMNFKPIRGRPCRIMWSHRDPSLRKSGVGNIFVKHLAKSIDNKTLYDTFSMFGNILSCKVATNSKGESLGYGFVHYESDEAANDAIARVDGKVIAGEIVSVAAFRSRKERGLPGNQYTNVYIKNLPPSFTKDLFDKLCSEYGNITSSMLGIDENGRSKGFVFVNFATPEQASVAVASINERHIDEKPLYAGRAQKKDERERELRARFEALKREREQKYAGVNLYIKNLSDSIDDDRLMEEFKQFGSITSARVMRDAQEKSRGFGFVCFSAPEEATRAVTEMNGRMLDGKPLYVALAQRREVRRAQLEAQHAARAKLGVPQPTLYPQGGPQMYFQPGMQIPQRNFYQSQMAAMRRFPPNMQQQMSMPMPRGYQLMPIQGAAPVPAGPQQQPQQQQMAAGRGGGQQRRRQGGRQQVRQGQADGLPSQSEPLTIKALAAAPEDTKKQLIGERLFPQIKSLQPDLAGKITGMLLEMDNGELIHLLESRDALIEKVDEAMAVLAAHDAA